MRRFVGLALAVALGLSGCALLDSEPGPATRAEDPEGPCSVASGEEQKFPTQSGDRLLTALVPKDADSGSELVVALHPAGGYAASMASITGFDELAERDDVIVVYPQQGPEEGIWDLTAQGPDVTYVGDLINYLHAHGCGSPATTAVIGYSAGAMLTSRLLCRQPQTFEAGVMVSGAIPPTAQCASPRQTRIVVVHGTDDDIVGFDAGELDYVEVTLGWTEGTGTRVDVAAEWSRLKGCDAPGRTSEVDGALQTAFVCSGIAPTAALVVPGGTHAWTREGFATSDVVWSLVTGG